ncbi:MAG: cation:proton antiporter [Patescibacteria group bacterium]|jgi:Kef-type K+ transport system membrane component KefB
MDNIFFEISAIIIVSTALALLARLIKQPTVLAFILTGILLGPLGLNWLQSKELMEVLASFGIAFVLYLIGIELDIRKFKALNNVALFSGIGQVVFTGVIGFILAVALGFPASQAWILSLALTFSSTIIVVKLLGEARQLDSLYGRIAVAILVLQDFFAVLALLILESLGKTIDTTALPWVEIGLSFVKASAIGLLAWLLAKYVFRRIFIFIGHSQELLFLWSIAWCFLFALLAMALDFPVTIAVFLAGVAIAGLDYNYEISARIRSLRDFFIVIFFAVLGSQLVLTLDAHTIWLGVLLALFVLIGNPLIVYIILISGGHQPRVALFVGLSIGQISEFSFILANRGVVLGFLDQTVVSLIAFVGLVTMVGSTYFITYNEQIYRWLKPLLYHRWLQRKKYSQQNVVAKDLTNHIVIFGYYSSLNKVLKELKELNKEIVIIDYNPASIKHIARQAVQHIYGDMRDEDILKQAQLDQASLIISIVPYPEPTLSLLQYAKHFKLKADIIVSARHLAEVEQFYKAGATFVLHPDSISLQYLKDILHKEELVKVSKLHKEELRQLRAII